MEGAMDEYARAILTGKLMKIAVEMNTQVIHQKQKRCFKRWTMDEISCMLWEANKFFLDLIGEAMRVRRGVH